MQRVIAATIGILLATAAVSTFAAKQDRENLAQCKADITGYYGEGARTRLRSIKRGAGETHLRLMVTPKGGKNTVIVCSVTQEGASTLATGDGIALKGNSGEQKVSLVK